jgi:hypothetical protein
MTLSSERAPHGRAGSSSARPGSHRALDGFASDRVDILLREKLGHEIQVRLLRMDPDSGQIFVTERAAAGRQLPLF